MESIYRASRAVALLHGVAGWLGHTWGWLSEDALCESVLRANVRGDLSPEGIAGEIAAACAAYREPGPKGWGVTAPTPSTKDDGRCLIVPVGSAASLAAYYEHSYARYEYLFADGHVFSVELRMQADGYWQRESVACSMRRPRPIDIYRAAVVLARAGSYLPECTDDVKRAVAEEYDDESLATESLKRVGPWVLAGTDEVEE